MPLELLPVEDGEARLRIDSFALTANNVTYAAIGDAFGYWDFFPATKDHGIVPVWGHATVVETAAVGLHQGERIYGYLPMATHLTVRPVAIGASGFTDGMPHRAARAAVYNQYRRLDADPGHRPGMEEVRAVFEPLFKTSFLIEAMFARASWYDTQRLIVTSASSKTALALAHVTRAAAPHVERIGLTAAANVAFVMGSGLYDRVLAYDAIETLAGTRAVAVDFAGNGATLARIHTALGQDLAYSSLVGLTDWARRGGAKAMAGPTPVLFFAPDHMAAMIGERGGKAFNDAVGERWRAFTDDAARLIRIAPVDGLDAAAAAFTRLVAGEGDPAVAVVIRL